MPETTYLFFLGVDLGSQCHQVRLLDRDGHTVAERSVDHGGPAIRQMVDWLARLTAGVAPAQVAAAVEAPNGVITDVLLEHGCAVFSINPKQLDRFRDRFSVAGAKDDRRDALVLAASLRTDEHHFRRLSPQDPSVIRLREWCRTEGRLAQDLRGESNRLWGFLQRYFPALLLLCPAADEAWLWALLKRCSAIPARAAKLRLNSLEQLLRSHRIRRFSAEQLHAELSKTLPLAPGVDQAIAEQVLLVLPHLQLLQTQQAQVVKQIQAILDELTADEDFSEHRSIAILRSIPGVGRVCTAAVLAEAFQPLQLRDYHGFRSLAGIAPVTQQSGKTCIVSMRRACNPRLRQAIFHAAQIHMQHDERARLTYNRLREKGKTHARAVRGVADRLLELMFYLLRQQTLYDPARRAAA